MGPKQSQSFLYKLVTPNFWIVYRPAHMFIYYVSASGGRNTVCHRLQALYYDSPFFCFHILEAMVTSEQIKSHSE